MSRVAAGNEIREFLTTRRARITPEQAGLRAVGSRRRVTGLRREEVAMLAGISVEYYTQLERGTVRGVSEDVLDAISRALQLDDVERSHLFDLVRAAKQRPAKGRRTVQHVRLGVQRLLDSMTEAAAFVRNSRLDILSANRLGYALYSEAFSNPARPANLARFVFLDPRARDFYIDWDGIADAGVGSLRAAAGRDPYDQDLTALVGELSMRSDDFRERWAAHDVRQYQSGTQGFRHPLVGELMLTYEALELRLTSTRSSSPTRPTRTRLRNKRYAASGTGRASGHRTSSRHNPKVPSTWSCTESDRGERSRDQGRIDGQRRGSVPRTVDDGKTQPSTAPSDWRRST